MITALIRQRNDEDLDECVRLLADVHREDGYPVNWPDRPSEWLSPEALSHAWVAELDGKLVGHVGLSRRGEGDLAPGLWSERSGQRADDTAVLSRLFVTSRARGHGIGALLVNRAMAEAQQRGVHAVLDVVASDTAAAALYERLGWVHMATVEQRWSPSQVVTVRCYAAP
ncbi:GNAT family N-acetyltransferase [Allokutzneria sp. NRRL B-24872]|uniref:GNAT family N-acetyltransferase n=1 Tax=Allokutzneria sp. NRRL B-24872 TaxID=1137961 RepID=UPI001AEFA7BA|nr:GNAT family N-acetyltransferase [Allokutzneria sp. NRRL B-24872]